ncbi:helix-turn-helix domain-containing protein [Chromobacterium haemolyticum]|uniref:helix-turn-helix domain-containing protein n=1 Tax=Chromobacterium haemolyticum TaxID=394935 RepID=UPI002446DF67|nr:helix-turn-helix transcriptional regulator [Chromobacterium haemolyticum]MDH0342173.1 helix-turn-helix domain-containing protein [Chromobacterium haemolyticum]
MKNRYTSIIFGKVLRELRTERKQSQEALAFDADLDRTYIYLLEQGQRTPSLDTMLALSGALKITLAHMASLIEQKMNEDHD